MRKLTMLLLAVIACYSCKKAIKPDDISGSASSIPALTTNSGGGGSDSVYTASTYAGVMGSSGLVNGSLTTAKFNSPEGVVFDSSGNMFICDRDNNCIRKIASGTVSVFAGSSTGVSGFTNGTGTTARFNSPIKLAIDGSNNLYVCDRDNGAIRKITSAGVVTTLAGNGTTGDVDGAAASAEFNWPIDVCVDGSGVVYVADSRNHKIRKISGGTVSTFAGGTQGYADGTGTAARFNQPCGITFGSGGSLLVADRFNACIRRINVSTKAVTTYIGKHPANYTAASDPNISSDTGHIDGPATIARFREPYGIACTTSGTVYVSDIVNHNIRRYSSSPNGDISTLAGSNVSGNTNGDFSKFNTPAAMVIDASGNIYVADVQNHVIRKLSTTTRDLLKTSGWTSTTVATGLTWYRMENYAFYERYNNLTQSTNVNILDLDPAYFKFTVKTVDLANATTVTTMSSTVTGAIAAINGTFGNRGASSGPDHDHHGSYLRLNGSKVVDGDGVVWDGNISYQSELWWQHEGEFHWDFTTSTFGMSKCNMTTHPGVYDGAAYSSYSNMISGSPLLIDNHTLSGTDTTYYQAYTGSTESRAMSNAFPRTAVAILSNNHILLITVDGHEENNPPLGLTGQDLTMFLQLYFNPKYALNLDGGGSSTMAIKGYGDPDGSRTPNASKLGVVNYPNWHKPPTPWPTTPFDRQRPTLENSIVVIPK